MTDKKTQRDLYAIPGQWLRELLALCGPEQHELRERVMASASPALDAEAIKAEFLERTGQYLTNDASREACIAEPVAEAACADTVRLDWMEQHDGRFYNHDRIACIVGTGFLIGSLDQLNREHDTLRGAIDAARAAQAKEGNAA